VEGGKKDSVTNQDALSSSTGGPPKEALETQAEEVNNTSRSTDAKDSRADKAKSSDAADKVPTLIMRTTQMKSQGKQMIPKVMWKMVRRTQ
jgi:hypothetical protein